MNNSISEVNINLQFDYDNFHELVKFAITDSLTIDGEKVGKDLPIVDQLETELLEKDFEIKQLKERTTILENQLKAKENFK